LAIPDSDTPMTNTGTRARRLPRLHQRRSGVLLHPTSLPGPYGSGDIGPEAHRFAERVAAAGQSWWQMLPVGPLGFGNSPYSAQSAFAGNTLLVSPDALVQGGLLRAQALPAPLGGDAGRADYVRARQVRDALLRQAFVAFSASGGAAARRMESFRDAQASWLPDYALYRALKGAHGERPWPSWDGPLRDRKKRALEQARQDLAEEIAFEEFAQLMFAEQWRALRDHTAALGLGLIGDVPIFVAHDSADVWQHQELFRLDAEGQPTVVAGVPPDYFSKTGQLWGNPLYRWGRMEKTGFAFWVERIGATLEQFDAIRLDHFIGFHRNWQIPAGAPTAETGEFASGPGAALFKALQKRYGELPLIAEDLGVITPAVKKLRDRFGLPGIRILQFAFGDDPSAPDFLPHAYPRRAVVYTGTHDNDTTVGWFSERAGVGSTRSDEQIELERRYAMRYLGSDGSEIHWDMIRMTWLSVADLAIVPLQDVLGLGSEARMNLPGTASGNWEWRLPPDAPDDGALHRLAELTTTYDRAPNDSQEGAR
jgi:4-alpha-glucanotransferase